MPRRARRIPHRFLLPYGLSYESISGVFERGDGKKKNYVFTDILLEVEFRVCLEFEITAYRATYDDLTGNSRATLYGIRLRTCVFDNNALHLK